jgi:hypothetical protein
MVSPSRKHLFRIGHAQHVRTMFFPLVISLGWVLIYIYMHRIVMQQAVIKCCRSYVSRACPYPTTIAANPSAQQSPLDCLETVAGVIQVGTQWFLFSVMCVRFATRNQPSQANLVPSQPRPLHTLLSASSQICHPRY